MNSSRSRKCTNTFLYEIRLLLVLTSRTIADEILSIFSRRDFLVFPLAATFLRASTADCTTWIDFIIN